MTEVDSVDLYFFPPGKESRQKQQQSSRLRTLNVISLDILSNWMQQWGPCSFIYMLTVILDPTRPAVVESLAKLPRPLPTFMSQMHAYETSREHNLCISTQEFLKLNLNTLNSLGPSIIMLTNIGKTVTQYRKPNTTKNSVCQSLWHILLMTFTWWVDGRSLSLLEFCCYSLARLVALLCSSLTFATNIGVEKSER